MSLAFTFHVDDTLRAGIDRLAPVLGYTIGGGIEVTASASDTTRVVLADGKAVITYARKHLFFRALGLLCEHAKTETAFDITEDSFFTVISTMIDVSRCAAPTVATINRLMDYLAVMGYGMAMLYTEDMVELPSYRYLGYMRGRYTCDDLRAIDDYAFDYGIEVIPCLECYGHMHKYLKWAEAAPIRDTAGVLLAREEKTFAFVEELISTVCGCFRSKRIHIGMDEAWDMGRGKFLDIHGYVHPFTIFNEFMDRLIAITNKYGLQPMMWSDMYFRMSNDHNGYYDADIEIPADVAAKIPPEVELIFWHYGEGPFCDNYMLEKHTKLGRKIIFGGGSWSWIGHFPEHNYTMETSRFSLEACRNHGVTEAMLTLWFNDNAECDLFANLFGLSFFAELCYDKDASDEKLRARFEATTGADYDAFYTMSLYHNRFEGMDYSPRFHDRYLGKPLFWQDIMEGLYDTHLFARADAGIPMSEHYADCAEKMAQYHGGTWDYLYDFAYKVFDYLAVKTKIGELLVPSYKAGDRETLAHIANTLLPLLKEKTQTVHAAHKAMWFASYRVLGWSNMDIRYGGMACRCDTAKALIEAYLAGESDCLEELEVERLHKSLGGFAHYSDMTTPNLKV